MLTISLSDTLYVSKDPRTLPQAMERSYYLSMSDSKMNASFAREEDQTRDHHRDCTILGSAKQCSIFARKALL